MTVYVQTNSQINNNMQMQEQAVEKVQYVSYDKLLQPSAQAISQGAIDLGFQSKEWFIQFQTITNLRQANRYYSSLFLNQLLPINYKQIVAQVDNLRSNNSKEALTLLSQIIEFQPIEQVECSVIKPLVAALMSKSVSEKGFLKSQALKGLNHLPKHWNPWVLEQLCVQTQALNGQISELAIRLISQILESKTQWEVDGKFLKNLSSNLNGKRAVVQKKARQILKTLKQRLGEEKLQVKINTSTELLEEESNTLRREMKEKEEKAKGPSLKDFLKNKKQS